MRKAFSFGNFGRNDFAKEGADEMEHKTNIARTDLGSTSRDMAPLMSSLVKQKPRLHMDLHFPDLPVLSTRQANRYEEIMEPSTPRYRLAGQVSPPKPPQGWQSCLWILAFHRLILDNWKNQIKMILLLSTGMLRITWDQGSLL